MDLTVKAYAKINLWLDITGRREDGYHTLNTVMHRIGLYDDIYVSTNDSETITTECDDPAVPTGKGNIAHRAAAAFYEKTGIKYGADIRIAKRIPLEAGLGGSSTDGAAVLTALNRIFGDILSIDELCRLGASLGADVPFCIMGGTAKCTGIGDIMQPAESADFAVVVIKPEFSCSTGAAYRAYDSAPLPVKAGFDEYCAVLPTGAEAAAKGLYNVFELLYGDERIMRIKQDLLRCGALGAGMTGSGSAVFGIFPDHDSAKKAAGKLDYKTKFAVM